MPSAFLTSRQGKTLCLALLVVTHLGCSGSCSDIQGTTPTPPEPPAPPPTPTLYAWANPITIAGVRFADHTWVTTYDAPSVCPPSANYWYSWGRCHPTGADPTPRLLDHGAASLDLAKCICEPDVESFGLAPGNRAHGGIDFYGISGVCHQLCNRILFATGEGGGTPSTVSGAHGYPVSRFLFGTYGSDAAEWAERKSGCRSPAPSPIAARRAPVAMTLEEDLAAMLRERLGLRVAESMQARLGGIQASLRSRKVELDQRLLRGAVPPRAFAEEVNLLVNQHLSRAAELLGSEQYELLFGIPPGLTIGIVDPDVAERSRYK